MAKPIPEILKEVILPFNWDVKKVWMLKTPQEKRDRKEFDNLLEMKLWSSRPKAGMLFDVSPMQVLENPNAYPHQIERIHKCCLGWPLDFLIYKGRLWILDGIHRLAKHFAKGSMSVLIRIHPETVIDEICED